MYSSLEKICCPSYPQFISYNPVKEQFALALVSGEIQIYDWDKNLKSYKLNKCYASQTKPCRCVRYFPNGQSIISCGVDQGCVIRSLSGEVLWDRTINKTAINVASTFNDTCFATGDDDGILKIWDFRKLINSPTIEFHDSDGPITEVIFSSDGNNVITSSGDLVQIHDIRMPKGKLEQSSNPLDNDILSLLIMKDGKKVVCGTESGSLDIYNWSQLLKNRTTIKGLKRSVDSMIKINEDLFCTGSSDGFLRIISLSSNKAIETIGQHKVDEACTIQSISINNKKSIIISCGSDETIRFHRFKLRTKKRSNSEVNLDVYMFVSLVQDVFVSLTD